MGGSCWSPWDGWQGEACGGAAGVPVACCLGVSPGHMPGGAAQAGTPGGVPVPRRPPWLDMGYPLSGCRLVGTVLCDTARQLSPLPWGGRAVQVLCCLWEVAPWFGGQLCWDQLICWFYCPVLCPWGGWCQNQSKVLGVLAQPCSCEGGCAPTSLGVEARGFGGA